ncbi:unknown [Prevotella sp. CAG:386]|nr:unknown [Prevotella sp. CAG:386]
MNLKKNYYISLMMIFFCLINIVKSGLMKS